MKWYSIERPKDSPYQYLFNNHGFQSSMQKCTLGNEIDNWKISNNSEADVVPSKCVCACQFNIALEENDVTSFYDEFADRYKIIELKD